MFAHLLDTASKFALFSVSGLNDEKLITKQDWIVQCFTSPPTQYRLYWRQFLQVKRPNQQYQSTEGKSTKENNPERTKQTYMKLYNMRNTTVLASVSWSNSYTQYMIDNYALLVTCSTTLAPHSSAYALFTSRLMAQQDVAILDYAT